MRHYRHLSIGEREKILSNHMQGKSERAIARELGRSPSTISREKRRIAGEYSLLAAQADYEAKRMRSRRPRKLVEDERLMDNVAKGLMQDWSPEQVSGRLEHDGKGNISYNTIYRGLERGDLDQSLRRRLRIKGRPYRKGHKGRTGKLSIEHSIHERPLAANLRTELGHWESDTVLGSRGSGLISTSVERQSRYVIITKPKSRKADDVTQSIFAAFTALAPDKRKTFTVDHGKEWSHYKELQATLNTIVYFADPGNPGQRGTNENTNGLIRQYLPKRSSFQNVDLRLLQDIADRLNHRPRKSLGWLTPFEVFCK